MNKLSQAVILIIIGALAGLATFRLSAEGKLPITITPGVSTAIQGTQATQTLKVVDEQNAVEAAVEKNSPSVVAIAETSQGMVNPFDPFANPQDQQQPQSGTIGTGFVVAPGVIVTNRHVVSDTSVTYTVVSKDGKKFTPQTIYRDPTIDLAIIKINDTSLKTLDLGDSSKLKVGQTVIAIGNALGQYDNTVTTGVVSGLGRSISAGDPYSGASEEQSDVIQTDAAINPGNSGGPLLNSGGQVIGVNFATTEGAQNIGFAIPINSVKPMVNQFIQTGGNIQRAYLGIQYQFLSKDLAMLYQYPEGAYIHQVVSGSPADKAGIQQGDIITKIDGQDVTSENTISQVTQNKKVGDNVSLEIWSNGNTKTLNVTLGVFPNQ